MSLYAKEVLTGRAYTANSGSVNQGYADANEVPFALSNPVGSNVDCVIWKASLSVVLGTSVTLAAGSLVLAANPDTTNGAPGGWGLQPWGPSPWGGGLFPSTGVQVAVTPCFIGNTRGVGAQAQAFAASGTTGVTAGTLTNVRPLWIVTAQTTTQPTPSAWQPSMGDIDLGGELILAPGTILAFTFAPNPGAQAAQVQLGVTWSERPIAGRSSPESARTFSEVSRPGALPVSRKPIRGSRIRVGMERST